MKKSRFSEEQIINILRETQAGSSVREVCAKHNVSEATYYAWKRKYGGMQKNCSVKLIRILDEDAQGKFKEKFRFAVPRSMVWAPAEKDPEERTIYDYEILDLGNLYLSDGELKIRYASYQGGKFDGNCMLGKRRQYVFKVVADGSKIPGIFAINLRPKKVKSSPEWPHEFALDVEIA